MRDSVVLGIELSIKNCPSVRRAQRGSCVDAWDKTMSKSLYMVIERFKGGDAAPVYRRFRDHGRLAPEGLSYVSSWVDTKLERCYQLMETDNRVLLDEWIAHWSDIVDFEVYPVISSTEAAERIAPLL